MGVVKVPGLKGNRVIITVILAAKSGGKVLAVPATLPASLYTFGRHLVNHYSEPTRAVKLVKNGSSEIPVDSPLLHTFKTRDELYRNYNGNFDIGYVFYFNDADWEVWVPTLPEQKMSILDFIKNKFISF